MLTLHLCTPDQNASHQQIGFSQAIHRSSVQYWQTRNRKVGKRSVCQDSFSTQTRDPPRSQRGGGNLSSSPLQSLVCQSHSWLCQQTSLLFTILWSSCSQLALPPAQTATSPWDYNIAESRGSFLIYPQTLLVGLKAAAKWLANLSKVYNIRQRTVKSQAVFLKCLQETFGRYAPYDPEFQESTSASTLSFINQSSPDMKRKLQRLECLREKSTRNKLWCLRKSLLEGILQK